MDDKALLGGDPTLQIQEISGVGTGVTIEEPEVVGQMHERGHSGPARSRAPALSR